ncbi:MAG: tRNA pseudouridine(55) synthase TruB [Lachnospiraceae bacterium]|nr:tRNA pseudouridine(55) synthase TruB [Lachnospiraceae bacterium]MDD6448439.1 tRNA pseudouridine(55) synthase TruB [Lachnospiraceae bacterium]
MKSGCILIDKPAGFTSFDVVAKLRGMLHEKKIGHNGTLDPDATGLLEVFIGRGTKAVPLLSDHDKTYRAVLRLGLKTDTEDLSGQVLSDATDRAMEVSEESIQEAFSLIKEQKSQIPPMYSAKKIGGKKLYELARQGQVIERKAVPIEIYELTIEEIRLPEVVFTAHVSKGTFIRTICSDIGEKLGVGGCMASLRRTKIGQVDVNYAYRLEDLQELADQGRVEEALIPLDQIFPYPKAFVLPKADRYLKNGNPVYAEEVLFFPGSLAGNEKGSRILLYLSDQVTFAGIFEKKESVYRAVKMFLE